MLAEMLAVVAERWLLVAAGVAILLLIGLLLLLWQRQQTWWAPLREYEREQRALAAFRDHVAGRIGARSPGRSAPPRAEPGAGGNRPRGRG